MPWKKLRGPLYDDLMPPGLMADSSHFNDPEHMSAPYLNPLWDEIMRRQQSDNPHSHFRFLKYIDTDGETLCRPRYGNPLHAEEVAALRKTNNKKRMPVKITHVPDNHAGKGKSTATGNPAGKGKATATAEMDESSEEEEDFDMNVSDDTSGEDIDSAEPPANPVRKQPPRPRAAYRPQQGESGQGESSRQAATRAETGAISSGDVAPFEAANAGVEAAARVECPPPPGVVASAAFQPPSWVLYEGRLFPWLWALTTEHSYRELLTQWRHMVRAIMLCSTMHR